MQITAQMVKELRDMTGAGMMDCKKALQASEGDMEKAVKWLRENDLAAADKKAGRIAAEGIVDSYIHEGGRIGVLIEVNIETDFAAKNDEFKALVRDMAMQVAAMNPLYVKREDIPEDVIEHEREIARVQAIKSGKPEKIVEKIVDGRIEKYYQEVCLLEQAYIRDDSKTCEQLIKEMIGKIGENIQVRRFVRYEMGEGLEKKNEDFAQEVAAQFNK
ncbi:MAG: translation elongation factor Ts [Clostridiales bacterium]|jgi:elongation factor Ts|nr:translation elongation factor Ts [Clostridiales bacterium]MDD2572093.1 translation elongation factor Ts [Eubacteriales bacterium]MDY0119202.1 translation elongation factor Ts [Clostridia bacterium]MCK9350960.1 translation elongation factor Ts [Clostridiales bacterium]MDD3418814.1 translation elongation factor Ts [Eubacteriales bacterium]